MSDRSIPILRSALLIAAAVLGPTSARALASVIVVDSSGGGDFTSVFAAVQAAAEGDTILVRSNLVDAVFVIDGKSLNLVGDVPVGSNATRFVGAANVRNLAPGQRVVFRNLECQGELFGGGGSAEPGIDLRDNAGAVWIESCTATGAEGNGTGFGPCFTADLPGGDGVRVKNCSAVTVIRCTLLAGDGDDAYDGSPFHDFAQATDGGNGLRADASTVAVYQSALTGGPGGFGHICAELADGGAGLRAIGASVLLSGCTLAGGGEGPGPPAGTPGAGLRGDASSSLEWHDATAVAAPGGIDVDVAPGTLTTYAGITRVFSLTSPLREGQFGTLTLQGVQGDFVGFFWSFGSSFLPKPGKNGWFLLGPPIVSGPYFIGAIGNPSGSWSIPIHAPALQPALQAQTFLLQAWFQYPGGVTLASGTSFTVLDTSF